MIPTEVVLGLETTSEAKIRLTVVSVSALM